MNALFFTSNYYESPFQVGDHHLARAFAADGYRVAFVSAPITPLHIYENRAESLRERFQNYRSGGYDYQVGAGEIWSYVPGTLFAPNNRPLLRSRFTYEHWIRTTIPSLRRKLKTHGFETVDLLYFSSPIFHRMLHAISHKRSMLRIMDDESGYTHLTPQDQRYKAALAKEVDLVAYTAYTLREKVEQLQVKRSIHLPNGVILDHFLDGHHQKPPEYEGITKPIVLYVGVMSYWFDSDLVNTLAERMPEIAFVLIGPEHEVRQKIKNRSNIHLLGIRKYKDLPIYMHHADIGLIAFNRSAYPILVNSINPLKLYEYAACGLPIVSSRWKELEEINPPARLCDQIKDYTSAIRDFIEHPVNPEDQIAFAKQFDWEAQYQRLSSTLSKIDGHST